MKRLDPLLPFAEATRGPGAAPLDGETRAALWLRIEARHRRSTARRRAVVTGIALACAAAVALAFSRRPPSQPPRAALPVAMAPPRVAPQPEAPTPAREDAVVTALDESARYVVVRTPTRDLVDVTLSVGGVRCEVVHREARRFTVLADGVRIVDRGTRFDVTLLERVVLVRVDEGTVEVTADAHSTLLRAGEQGRFPRASVAARSAPRATVDVSALLAEADAAMARSDLARAETLLRTVAQQHRGHPRAQAASLRLGRLLREQGRVDDAVGAFEDARVIAPGGSLVESAWSQEIATLLGAGRVDDARAAARRYAREHTEGLHLDEFRRQGLLP